VAEWTAEQVKEFVEAIFGEQRRGMLVAEEEREKAAVALRAELTRQIDQGDQSLREHVNTQIEQISLLATSLDEQSRLRIEAVEGAVVRVEKAAEQHVEQLRREREMVTEAQMEAIAKAEGAAEKRFESVNEFRANLADQTASFIPREVHDAEIAALRKDIGEAKGLAQSAKDQAAGKREAQEGMSKTTALGIAFVAAGLSAVGIVVTVVLAANGAI
jgi:hypothetical protein